MGPGAPQIDAEGAKAEVVSSRFTKASETVWPQLIINEEAVERTTLVLPELATMRCTKLEQFMRITDYEIQKPNA
jgi:hypothetical protein